MFKRILQILFLAILVAYLFLAMVAFNRKPVSQPCKGVELVIKDSVHAGFITQKEIVNLLTRNNLNPIGKDLNLVHSRELEDVLAKQPLIDKVECYKTPSGKICVEVSQRIPILRVMDATSGRDYYLDGKGDIMPSGTRCVAHLVVATGKIENSFARNELYKFAVYLQHNPFWNAQIEQINVLSGHKVELVPRVGNHMIYVGRMEHMERKMERLKIFYEKVLNKVGWNKYSRINIEFSNQIVCTKNKAFVH